MMKKYSTQKGFTLIETLIAIFILTMTVGGLLTLASNGYFSVRYSRNQIVATNLLQESLEYVRNSRDTNIQQGGDWSQWVGQLSANGCMSSNGCIVDPYTTSPQVRPCSATCDATTFYPDWGFYGYANNSYPSNGQQSAAPYATTYIRTITIQQTTADQLVVTGKIEWMNGNAKKTASQSILLTNWTL